MGSAYAVLIKYRQWTCAYIYANMRLVTMSTVICVCKYIHGVITIVWEDYLINSCLSYFDPVVSTDAATGKWVSVADMIKSRCIVDLLKYHDELRTTILQH